MIKSNFKTLIWAERTAEHIIDIKDIILGGLIDWAIPHPETRKRLQQKFKKALAWLSKPLSNKVDRWIETNVITVANLLSYSRIPAGILLIAFSWNDLGNIYYLSTITWAGFSDYIDGVIARKMKQQTELGAATDALCDKIFAACAAVSFLSHLWLIPAVFFFFLDSILALMAYSLLRAKRQGIYQGEAEIKSNWLGKLKFNLQAAALLSIIWGNDIVGNYFLITADIFAVGSILRHLEPKKTSQIN